MLGRARFGAGFSSELLGERYLAAAAAAEAD
jgi:hypothetical protein